MEQTSPTAGVARGRADYDILRAEVHRKAMDEIAREMGITLVRTSGSPVVTEAKDLSCSVLDDQVEQIGFSSFVGLHISTSFLGVQAVLENYSMDELSPGDAFIVNDPHSSGALHQGDVGVIMPYFYDGDFVAWGYVNEHTIDVGGYGVSGFAAGARDVFWEGLRFPAVRFMQGGELSREWRLFLSNNVRAPSAVMNDLRSMVAAVNTGQNRLTRTIDQFGLEAHREYCEINKTLSEQMVRRRLASVPDGVYRSTDWVEYDGLDEPMLLEVTLAMTVSGDEMRLDFRGVPQIPGPINGAKPAVLGQAMNTLQCVLLYDVPANAGLWRPLEIDLGPTGTIVNSVSPAPVSYSHVGTGMRIDKLVRDALSQALSLSEDEKVRARVSSQPCEGDMLTTLAGIDRRSGNPTVLFPVAPTVGLGGPAQTTGDGQDTYSNTCNLGVGMSAVEADEATTPVLVLWRRIQQGSAGAGTTQGGHGMTTAFQIRGADSMSGTGSNNCADVPPRGAGGGLPGAATDYKILTGVDIDTHVQGGAMPTPESIGGTPRDLPANTSLTVDEGDLFFVTNGGGGGLGDPLLRAPELVARDVTDGYVAAEFARDVYGVVVDDAGDADEDATRHARAQIREARIGRAPAGDVAPEDQREIGIGVRLNGSNWSCGYCAADLGAAAGNYRSACVERTRPIAEVFSELGMKVRSDPSAPTVVLSEYFCPECASSVRADVALEGADPAPAPELVLPAGA
ncbi:MAG: N-methylhydantoinase [Solirubrobacteraceae bacterium]|nr:N-methylhydantoinase [Solirubrobacteraceae bacterium]